MSWVQYDLLESTLDQKYVVKTSKYLKLLYPCTENFSCNPYIVNLTAGTYAFECFGASGGKGVASEGGKGGYSKGIISFKNKATFFVFIGGSGSTGSGNVNTRIPGGFNGGGDGVIGTSKIASGSGGGATDIRNNSNARIIVAGGGGGAGTYYLSPYNGPGGNGGGIVGIDGENYWNSNQYKGTGGASNEAGKNLINPSDGVHGSSDVSSGGGGGGGYFQGGGGYCSGGGGDLAISIRFSHHFLLVMR